LSDVFGVTGQKILKDIIAGNYQPEKLLHHVHGKVQKSREEIKEAITGNVTGHHRFMLQTILESIEKIEDTIFKLDFQISKQTAEYGIELELLDSIPGVDKDGAICIIAEIKEFQAKMPHRVELWKSQERIKEIGWEKWYLEMVEYFTCQSCNSLNGWYDFKCRKCDHSPGNKFVENHSVALKSVMK
jgi:hypothetical protein